MNETNRARPAYLIANYNVTNQEGYDAYFASVGPTILSRRGEILVAGPCGKPVEGTPAEMTVVLRFPSMDALQDWYDSPEYREIINLRVDNTEGHMVFAEAFAMPG
ncbi:MAG: DUF1330 domain-containing protein [Rubricoccaceae bacterium]|nr:DUF1330 domain-containing protein [Rubricoccaceae bacterium]